MAIFGKWSNESEVRKYFDFIDEVKVHFACLFGRGCYGDEVEYAIAVFELDGMEGMAEKEEIRDGLQYSLRVDIGPIDWEVFRKRALKIQENWQGSWEDDLNAGGLDACDFIDNPDLLSIYGSKEAQQAFVDLVISHYSECGNSEKKAN